ncbi:MAG: alpha/beta hydrolase, partial [Gammaproteobacteria bacterium]|nr:alpha/beta hydrolase [Gammaproteobacteria bacterium]
MDSTEQTQEQIKSLAINRKVTLGYGIWQPGSPRKLLILIHGMASNMTRWSEFLEHTNLKDDWDIIRIDLRGHGRSLHRGWLSMKTWCDDIRKIMDYENYHDAVVVGHSLGAQVAMNFAVRHAEQTRGLVLIDPVFYEALAKKQKFYYHSRFVIYTAVIGILLLNKLGLHRRHIPHRDLRKLDEVTRKNLLDSGKQQEMVDQYSSPWPDLKVFPTANLIQEFILSIMPLPSPRQVAVPVLNLLSKETTFCDPALTETILQKFPNGTVS